jgi:hypothetical protein
LQATVASPTPLAAIILKTAQTPAAFMRPLLLNVIAAVQTDLNKTGLRTMEAVFPAVMTILAGHATPVEETIELLFAQFVFVSFNCCDEARKADFIRMIVTPLCEVLSQKQQPQESAVAMFIGKGMTLLAKTAAEPFRDCVVALSEPLRAALQNVMRLVIQQQQAAESMAASAASASAPVKKIDMSRYKS